MCVQALVAGAAQVALVLLDMPYNPLTCKNVVYHKTIV
ncbi:hypothetical protein HMPREF9248_1230 [Fannyhessea vaginae PB189-T1-4]|uniref:Uncharacterized protein n=1 Tax=Fannyhessea vaginae PB189-T1-4 TaxID=866774 RepID=A0ABN0B194_9ACTN|nr:hypothetical protein HMPREF9248_1230 [Fannyhessea vaginae PB189-T1-4]